MNKKDFITQLALAGGFEKRVAEGVYQVFVATMHNTLLSSTDKLSIPEIGKFTIKTRKARGAVNPNTGEKISIPERKTVVFKPTKQLIDQINK